MPIRLALALTLAPYLVSALAASAADFDGTRRQSVAPPSGRVCQPAYVTRAPTNAPDDPTYVGSTLGLGRPSYYGNTPGPGIDDPFGRRLRSCT